MNRQPEDLDFHVRRYVYEVVLARGYPPTLAETAEHVRAPVSALQR
jgi:hypothetical protein